MSSSIKSGLIMLAGALVALTLLAWSLEALFPPGMRGAWTDPAGPTLPPPADGDASP